jgi:peptide/nickel transport system permease protein
MAGYILRRFLQGVGFVILSTLVTYTFMVVLIRDNPTGHYQEFKRILAEEPNSGAAATVEKSVGVLEDLFELDKPWPLNYLAWLFDPGETTELNEFGEEIPKGIDLRIGELHVKGSGALTGDFGGYTTWPWNTRGEPITVMIARGLPNTALLLVVSLIISVLLAVPLGIICAARQDSRFDHAVKFFQSASLSIPVFGLGLLLIIAFGALPYQWNSQFGWSWAPYLPGGSPYDTDLQDNWLNRLYHVILPALTLAIPQVALISRYIRSSMLEVLRQDYIRTAHAKGVPKWKVLARHAFRNAVIPLITTLALIVPTLASSIVIVEQLFAFGGLGQLVFQAFGGCVPTQDRPCGPGGGFVNAALAMPLMLILFTVISLTNMIADIMYVAADPRIDYTRDNARSA